MTSIDTAQRGSRVPVAIGGALVVALLLVALLAGNGSSSNNGPPLSPSSTSGTGTRALVLLLREFGADVRVGVPDDRTRVALILSDRLDSRVRDQVKAWVDGGGVLVVADPGSPFAAATFGSALGSVGRGRCTIPELNDVTDVEFDIGATYRVRDEVQACFGDERSAFVVSTPSGRGSIISVGTPEPFTNDRLDAAGNSVLATRLLLPVESGSVVILDPNPPGSGSTTLGDLVADRVFQAIIQLGVAFVIYALWRSRRIGRPVVEQQAVAIAGSQFVRAVGGLQQRTHATDRAATLLRADTRRLLSDRYSIAITTEPQTLAQLVSGRTGLDRDRLIAALGDTPILDEQALVHLSQELDTIRQEVLDGRTR